MNRCLLLTAYCLLSLLLIGCKAKTSNPDPTPAPVTIPETAQLKELADFPVGIECYIGILDYPVPATVVRREFDRFTAATLFWKGLEPTAGQFNFTDMDRSVAFAQQRNMSIHGHPLVYFQQGIVPDYITNFNGDRTAFEQAVKSHIQAIVSRYKGKVGSYDVANEFIDESSGVLYNSYINRFYTTQTDYETFLGNCFRWAREADSDAKLFYNEAKLERTDPKRLNAVAALVSRLKSAGVPIDGIGTQMHTDVFCPIGLIDSVLKKLAGTGLLVHISELDVSVNEDANGRGKLNNTALTPALSAQQREQYRAIVQSYRANVPARQQWGITCWDLMDHTSWLNQYRPEWPCLFDKNCDKKPAFYGFGEGLVR
jgi:endo-1,4-beta-xylanase